MGVQDNPPDKPAGFQIWRNWWGKPHPTINTTCKNIVYCVKTVETIIDRGLKIVYIDSKVVR